MVVSPSYTEESPMGSGTDIAVDQIMNVFKATSRWMLLAACLNISSQPLAAALGTGISYQGRLTANGIPVQGEFDLTLTLYDAVNAGNMVALPITNFNVLVTNGVFTTTLDFGDTVFNGNTYWLETALRPSGTMVNFSPLLPRQPITAAPYALYSPNAETASDFTNPLAGDVTGNQDTTLVTAIQGTSVSPELPQQNQYLRFDTERWIASHLVLDSTVAGTLSDLNLSSNIPRLNEAQNQTFVGPVTFDAPGLPFAVGNNNLIPDLNADLLDGLEATTFWNRNGNSGTNPGTDFVGTTDNTALVFRVNNGQALRLEPNGQSPILIGGWNGNSVASDAAGATISGGGSSGFINSIANGGTYATISGGRDNTIGASSYDSVIAGGVESSIESGAPRSTISGGIDNRIAGGADTSTIGGGSGNLINTGAFRSVIAGGSDNEIGPSADFSSIHGGVNNVIESGSFRSAIAGGTLNRIGTNADHAIIAGSAHVIDNGAYRSVIIGGTDNSIEANANYPSILGGGNHVIESGAFRSTIAGGGPNRIGANAFFSTISGGGNNEVELDTPYATIPGGLEARASHFGQLSYASGSFANPGDAQISTYVLRGETSMSLPQTELFLDGANYRMTVPANTTWIFDVLVVGRSTDSKSAGFKITGVVMNTPPDPITLIGSVEVTPFKNMDLDGNAFPSLVNSDRSLRIIVDGGFINPPTVRWVANVRTAEVSF